jgi:hypothetical protein
MDRTPPTVRAGVLIAVADIWADIRNAVVGPAQSAFCGAAGAAPNAS